MLFSSPTFFAFFGLFVCVYRFVPARWRLWTVIIGSAIFYAWWHLEYLVLPLALTFIGYFGASFVSASSNAGVRRQRLIFVLVILFAPLVFFKYTNFLLNHVIGAALETTIYHSDLALPLGISFITFTIAAYIIDVHRRTYPLERHHSRLLGYVLFFPHLIAGPILRPRELLPQLDRLPALDRRRATMAAAIFTVGLAKKLIIADQIAPLVDAVNTSDRAFLNWDYLLAIYGFAAQIYCDFSGYTDMAIGLAMFLGVRLPSNFARPYESTSIIEFWRRWHITLSHWLRDYLYISMGGNRQGKLRQWQNLFVTMVLGGLWHGANWTFVLWGAVHGLAIIAAHLLRTLGIRNPAPHWVRVVITFHFVAFAWILFRAPDIATAWRVASGPFCAPWGDVVALALAHRFPLLLLLLFLAVHRFDSQARLRLAVRRLPKALVWLAIALTWVLAITISQGSSSNFIYFDF
jgi:alginate O-acetyltransferase complex protein AlgI